MTAEARVVREMPAADYHASEAIGSTDLRNLLRSPAHFVAARKAPREETPAMRRGTAVHCAVLEPHRWDTEYVIAPKVDRRTKVGKETWENFEHAAAGKSVLTYDEAAAVENIREAVMAHPAAAGLLRAKVAVELPVMWEDETTGVACKGRIDLVAKVGGRTVLVDLKTTKDASPAGFPREIAQWMLHVQGSHYSQGWRAAHGEEPAMFALIAVEPEPPFAVGVYALDAIALDKGAALRMRALDLLCDCRASGKWPAYGTAIQTVGIPSWAEGA
jgi:hypothetical protein